jgi:polysaccharide deacetylase family protein (PEP-CTERM system associated)
LLSAQGSAQRPPAASRREPPFALSVDVEDYFQVEAFSRHVARDAWDRYPSRVVANTSRLLDLFDAAGAKGTFFVLGWVARRYPALVQTIASRGHEIASHGMSHQMITTMSPEEFRGEALESRRLLEDLSGRPVLGYRAPSYSVNRDTLWALEILSECGYDYDSSIYPIRGRRYGYPSGPTRPTRMCIGGSAIAEFPLPTLPLGPFRLPVLAGAYLRLLPGWMSLGAARYHRSRCIPMVVNVHPWEIDPDQPTVGASRAATWTHYARLGSTERVLRSVLKLSRFAPVRERLEELGLVDGPAARLKA